MNKFWIIVPFYNVSNYITDCVNIIISQNYDNYQAIFIDDNSSDGTSDKIPNNDKFTKVYNDIRLTALENIHNCLFSLKSDIDPDDIIIILDGDDALLHTGVLEYVNNIYKYNQSLLITYGQYITSNGYLGHCSSYTEQEYNNLRNMDWRASHLRSFKFKTYLELINQDPQFNCYKDIDGGFYKITYDIAILYPLMEIAGYNNIHFNKEPLYYYRLHPNNDHALNASEQKRVELNIKNKPKFKTIW